MSGASGEGYRWSLSVRVLANQIDRATLRTTVMHHFPIKLSLGLEYNPLAQDIGPLANWTALTETTNRPALIFGTSSDRIGTPHGRSVYGTLSKNLQPFIGLPLSPYAGVAWGSYESEFRPIAGADLDLTRGFRANVIFDGVKIHPMISYSYKRQHVFSFILAQAKNPGFSYSFSF